jgi:hypothetical protein
MELQGKHYTALGMLAKRKLFAASVQIAKWLEFKDKYGDE